ncbi:MAG: hypothetical protein J1F64_03160 [Oscillospiraceae bacterium]|nr:hypothetical protein [Oscillospiraceae bacterium]
MSMRAGYFPHKRQCVYLLLVFAVNLVKFISAGAEYLPLQDDFIQYWAYGKRGIDYLFYTVGLFSSRPFAGLLDIFLWSKFWGALGLAAAIITLLHFLSLVFFIKAFENTGIRCGMIFMLVYMLFPAGFEAVYWLSASTRIVVGLFFGSLSAYIAGKEKANAAVFFLSDILAAGFYEQTAAVCFFLCAWAAFAKKRADIFVCNIFAAAAVYLYYKTMADVGVFSGRIVFAPDFLLTLSAAARSFAASLKLLFIGGFLGICGIISLFAGGVVFVVYEKSEASEKAAAKLYIGISIAAVSLAAHFITGASYLPFRCLYPSAVGIALVCEYLSENINAGRVFAGGFAALALSANMYQADIFMRTAVFNRWVCGLCEVENGVVTGFEDIKRLGKKFNVPQWYEEYMIEDITQSRWAFIGAVRAHYGDVDLELSQASG